jgi:hypothetical protein
MVVSTLVDALQGYANAPAIVLAGNGQQHCHPAVVVHVFTASCSSLQPCVSCDLSQVVDPL